jgi:hypothetical protein
MRFPCFEAYFLEVTWHWRTYLILMQHISLFFLGIILSNGIVYYAIQSEKKL